MNFWYFIQASLGQASVAPLWSSSTALFSRWELAAASNIADQDCSSLVRQRHTGEVQRMNNSPPWAQTSCRETNIQQHLCVWKSPPPILLPSNPPGSFPLGKPHPGITPAVLSPNCQNSTNTAGMLCWDDRNVQRKHSSVYTGLLCDWTQKYWEKFEHH